MIIKKRWEIFSSRNRCFKACSLMITQNRWRVTQGSFPISERVTKDQICTQKSWGWEQFHHIWVLNSSPSISLSFYNYNFMAFQLLRFYSADCYDVTQAYGSDILKAITLHWRTEENQWNISVTMGPRSSNPESPEYEKGGVTISPWRHVEQHTSVMLSYSWKKKIKL